MKRAEHQPETISVTIYAGVFVKLWRVRDAGTLIPQQRARLSTSTLIMQGSVRAYRADELLGDYPRRRWCRSPLAYFIHFSR